MDSETPTVAILAAITSVTSSLALIFLIAFVITLILLVHTRCHKSDQGTPVEAPEANYSTISLPLPPVRKEGIVSEKNKAYGYLESQTAASFAMADNSAYGTAA